MNGDNNSIKDTISLTTKWGGLSLSLLLFIGLIGTGLFTFAAWEHSARSKEHAEMSCQIKLALFIQRQKSDEEINWRVMPTDLFPCIPKFMFESVNDAKRRDIESRAK